MRKASKEAARSVERKTLTHKGGYFKYCNDDWKGKRAGRYDGAKECRHIVSTRNKKVVKQGTLVVDAKYYTTELMEEKMG